VACDLASLSPKLANSTPWERGGERLAKHHDEHRICLPVIRDYMTRYDHQLKFVIESPEDVQEVVQLLGQLPNPDLSKVLLMPQGTTAKEMFERGAWLVELCKQHGFRYCPRLHIDLFGLRRGT
jgi:7-carboxy-7-deazaguanine synthase